MSGASSSELQVQPVAPHRLPVLPPAPADIDTLQASPAHALIEAAQPGDPLVITFGFAQWDRLPAFDFVGRLRKLEGLLGRRFHRIYLRDPDRAWYLRGVPGLGADVDATLAALAAVIEALQPSSVTTLGQSMGGYGAILYGRMLKADRVVAFGPLSTMDPELSESRGDTRWLGVMQQLAADGLLAPRTDLGAAESHVADTELRLHFGTRPDEPAHGIENLDMFHARRFEALPQVRVTRHADATHTVVEQLRLSDEIDAVLLQDLFDVDPARVHRRSQPVVADTWLSWIAENRLLGGAADTLVATMTQRGVDPVSARSAMAACEREPVFRAARTVLGMTRKYESVLLNQQRASELNDASGRIDRRDRIARDEFMERYVAASRPLVLTGVMDDWPARRLWSPEYLKTRHGHADVQVQMGRASDPAYEQNSNLLRRRMKLAQFVGLVQAVSGNDSYMTANNEALRQPPLDTLLADVGTLPPFLRRDRMAGSSHFWFGPAGTITPLHHDMLMLLHGHVVGRKRWRFISPMYTPWLYNTDRVYSRVDLDRPDLAQFPLFAGVKVLETVCGPGDAVFIPVGWWHQVTSLDTCISLALACFDFDNDFSYANPVASRDGS